MTRDDLVREFRVMAQDEKAPYLFSTAWIKQLIAEAEAEAAIRGRLLHASADPTICTIDISAGDTVYPLHESLYEIDYLSFVPKDGGARMPMRLVSSEAMTDIMHDWRDRTGTPMYAVQGDTSIRLIPAPDAPGTLHLEGYRLPLTDAAELEINAAHHRHLIGWVLHRAYSIPDTETIDLKRAADGLAAFTARFGLAPDSDMRRIVREDEVHHVTPFFV